MDFKYWIIKITYNISLINIHIINGSIIEYNFVKKREAQPGLRSKRSAARPTVARPPRCSRPRSPGPQRGSTHAWRGMRGVTERDLGETCRPETQPKNARLDGTFLRDKTRRPFSLRVSGVAFFFVFPGWLSCSGSPASLLLGY